MRWPFGLSARDQSIIRFLGRFKQANGQQLERLFFQDNSELSRGRVRQRVLTRLGRDNYIVRLPRKVGYGGGSELSHYVIGSAGLAILGLRPPRYEVNPHNLAVTELMVELTEALRAGQLDKLTFLPEPECWKELPGFTLKPDAYVEVERDRRYFWWIEIDLDTEPIATISRKLRRYEQALEMIDRIPRVLFIVESDKRLAQIKGLIRNHELVKVCLFDDAVETLCGVMTWLFSETAQAQRGR